MRKKLIAVLISASLAFPLSWGGSAAGSARAPASMDSGLSQPVKEAQPSLIQRFKSKLSRFRPVAKKNARLLQDPLDDRRTIDEVFDEEMSQRMLERYRGTVAHHEKEATNPFRRASRWELERYEQSRKDLANWTLKEVGKDQLKEFERRARRNSGALNAVASATSDISVGGGSESRPLTEEEKIARAHRMDLPVEEEEETMPTRIKAKLNVIKARGQLTFSNPVVMTMVEGGAGSGENLAVEMNRDFRSLELNSKVRYAVDESVLNLVVNKKITEEVSLDLNSQRWTGSKRGAAGEKKRETAKVIYSINF